VLITSRMCRWVASPLICSRNMEYDTCTYNKVTVRYSCEQTWFNLFVLLNTLVTVEDCNVNFHDVKNAVSSDVAPWGLVRTDALEERVASIFRVERSASEEKRQQLDSRNKRRNVSGNGILHSHCCANLKITCVLCK
jgi:hypothetical protein